MTVSRAFPRIQFCLDDRIGGGEPIDQILQSHLVCRHIFRSCLRVPVWSRITQRQRPFFANQAFKDSLLNKIALGRLGQLEDIMGAVVYLASPAAALVTGTSLVVDGGWTAH